MEKDLTPEAIQLMQAQARARLKLRQAQSTRTNSSRAYSGYNIYDVLPEHINPTGARIVGSIAGGVLTSGTGPMALLGASFLGEAAGQGAELYNEYLAKNTDPHKDLETRVREATTNIVVDTALGGVFAKGMNLAGKGMAAILDSKFSETAMASAGQLAQDFAKTKIGATAGSYGNKAIQGIEQVLSKMPTSAHLMRTHIKTVVDGLDKNYNEMLKGLGTVKSMTQAGKGGSSAVKLWDDAAKNTEDAMYKNVNQIIPAKTRGRAEETMKFIEGLKGRVYPDLEDSGGSIVSPFIEKLYGDIMREIPASVKKVATKSEAPLKASDGLSWSPGTIFDTSIPKAPKAPQAPPIKASGELSWSALAEKRTEVGGKIGRPDLNDSTPIKQLRNLYASLTADMESLAQSVGGDGLTAWKAANAFTKEKATRLSLIGDIGDSKLGQDAYKAMLDGSKQGPELLNVIKDTVEKVSPGDWKNFRTTFLYRMARATVKNQRGNAANVFSPRALLDGYNTYKANGVVDVMFDDVEGKALKASYERLIRISNALKDSEDMINRSGTTHATLYQNMLRAPWIQGAVTAGFGIAGGGLGAKTDIGSMAGTAAGVAASLYVPWATAKYLVTNPKFINWLGDGLKIPATNYNGIASHLGRINGIVIGAPIMQRPVKHLLTVMHSYYDENMSSVMGREQ